MSTNISKISTLFLLFSLTACSQSDDEKKREAVSNEQQASAQISQARNAQANKNTHPYNIEITQSTSQQSMVALGGSVIPKTQLTIRSQAPGRVVYLAGDEGTLVKAGEIIVDLDTKSLNAQRRAAIAGVQRARAMLNNAYIQLDQNIISEGTTSGGGMGVPSMFDHFITKNVGDAMGVGDSDYNRYASISSSRVAVEQAKSGVMEAESQVEQIETMFRDKQAVAPEDATILEKMIELGDAVQPGQPLLRIGDTSILQVVIDVPTRLMSGMQEGMTLNVSLDNVSQPVEAEIARIFPSADVQRNTVRIKLALPANTKATPGMYATVMVPDSSRNEIATIKVPSTALVWRGSQASIYIVNTNGQAELRLIRAGESSGDRISILSGVSDGERIITSPDTLLKSGMMIQTISTPTQS